MKSSDKFLAGIVFTVVLLVLIAFVVVLRRPAPAYQSEATPAGVAHNYLLALRQMEYERAFGYLSPTIDNYPESASEFAADVENQRWLFHLDDEVTLAVESARINGDQATAVVQETTFYQGDLFSNNQYTNTFNIYLIRSGDRWQIDNADQYWLECWTQKVACP